MLFNRVCFAILVMFFVVSGAVIVWAACHNDSQCEIDNIENDLLLGMSWDKPPNNRILYRINGWTIHDVPSLTTDVNYAASYWDSIEHDGQIVNFELDYEMHTVTQHPWTKDGDNVVGWGNLPWNDEVKITAKALLWPHDDDDSEIVEAGITFNYYVPWGTHADKEDDEYYLRNTATHEFGHWVGLDDLVPNGHCQDYERFTMWQPSATNHDKETLECEDKWGALHIYGTSGD